MKLASFRQVVLLLVLLLSACSPIQRSPESPAAVDLSLDAPLPVDPAVRIGTLANGLTYYIRHNEQPAQRAELMLGLNAGSLLEDEDQLGLAHFVEHMLFNGTERFAHNELVDFLESIGMEFGADLNASTSFDETIYKLHVPTDDAEAFDTAFAVLEDWAAHATLDPDEVEQERNIIVEEWRQGDANAQGRIFRQRWPVLMGDSQYSVRLPIGEMEVVRNAPVEALRRFYQDWYRPDLMAVVAVGDFDIDEVEAKIKAHFSSLPAPAQPRQRPMFGVPDHAAPRYLVVSDPEQPSTQIQVLIKQPATTFTTVADFRTYLLKRHFYLMLNQRLAELTRQEEAPFISASAYSGAFVRSVDATYYEAQVQDDGIATGLNALVTEIERVRLHGFTDSELERAKRTVLREFEQTYLERDDIDNSSWAGYFLDTFFTGDTPTSAETDYELAQALVPTLTVAEVNTQVDKLAADENRVVVVIAPQKEGLTLPTEAELATIYADVQNAVIEPYIDQVVGEPLIAEPPTPVAVTSETQNEELGVTTIELANGIRVLMKPTDFQEDEVVFTASSPGGLSLLSDEEYWAGTLIASVVAQSGVGAFNQTELQNLLAGQNVEISPSLNELAEGFGGSASPDDLETLFQLIYLYATAPRADAEAFAAVENQWTAYLQNRLLEPTNVLYDAINRVLYGDSIRQRVPTSEEITGVDRQRALEIYQERFADMEDFTFVFVGNFDPLILQELAQRYLGALPATPAEESWRDLSPTLPAGIVEEQVYSGQEEQSIVELVYTGPADPSDENQFQLGALQRLIELRVSDKLREELGGVYGAYVGAGMSVEPSGRYSFIVEFSCDPQRVDELVAALFALIQDVQENGPTADEVATVNQQIQRNREEALEQNSWWLGRIHFFATTPGRELSTLASRLASEPLTDAATLQATAQEYLLPDRYVKVVLYPASHDQ